ncbi:MAG: LacI family DNA-binding transcriptional regulator [Dethiobacteria bacterium]|jgi:LacI family transcriptional regulator|nr:LacI family DNA-binding transcriptional regulator [Bacillota bacterium]
MKKILLNSEDIARLAGVSRSTVSRVINNYANVPPETRARVEKVIEEYGYVPHASARSLAGKRNKVIGLFITNIEANPKTRVFENAYFSPFMAAATDYADEMGYNLLVLMVNRKSDFKKIRNLFYNRTLDGGIFIGVPNNSPDVFAVVNAGYKLVIVDQEECAGRLKESPIIVNSDSFKGAYLATQHLIELGHRRIAHIAGDLKKYSGFKRLEGFRQAMHDAGLPVEESCVVQGDFTEESGLECVKQLFAGTNPGVTAIFASNDAMAIGAMKGIKGMGLNIPADVSIAGYDDIHIASYISPSLTTVRSSILAMSSIAVKNLIKLIENGSSDDHYFTIPAELIVRESTLKAR